MNGSKKESEIRTGWALILSACTGIVFSSIVLPYYSIGPLVVPVTESLGWTRAQFQAAILFSSGLGAITAPAVGWLCDRYGSRRVAMPSLIGVSIGFSIAGSMNGELGVLYLAYGTMALLGAGTIPVSWTRAITTNFHTQRGLALGLTLTGTGICAVLLPQYTTWLVQDYGWRAAYFGIALLPLVIALPIVTIGFKPKEFVDKNDTQETSISGRSLRQASKDYRFWILLLSVLLTYMAVSGISPNLIPAITDAGMSAGEAATVQSLFGAAIVIGRVAVGYLVDRFWAPGVAAISMLLPVLGCWMLLEPSSFVTAAMAALLIGLAAGAELDLMSFLTAKYFGLKHYAQIYSVLYMVLAICSGSAPFFFAYLFDQTASYAVSFTVSGALFLLGALIILMMGRYPSEER